MKFIIKKPAAGQTKIGPVSWIDSMDEIDGKEIDIPLDHWSTEREIFTGVQVLLGGHTVRIGVPPEWLYPTEEDYSPLLYLKSYTTLKRFSFTRVRNASGLEVLRSLKEGVYIGDGQFAFIGGSDADTV